MPCWDWLYYWRWESTYSVNEMPSSLSRRCFTDSLLSITFTLANLPTSLRNERKSIFSNQSCAKLNALSKDSLFTHHSFLGVRCRKNASWIWTTMIQRWNSGLDLQVLCQAGYWLRQNLIPKLKNSSGFNMQYTPCETWPGLTCDC